MATAPAQRVTTGAAGDHRPSASTRNGAARAIRSELNGSPDRISRKTLLGVRQYSLASNSTYPTCRSATPNAQNPAAVMHSRVLRMDQGGSAAAPKPKTKQPTISAWTSAQSEPLKIRSSFGDAAMRDMGKRKFGVRANEYRRVGVRLTRVPGWAGGVRPFRRVTAAGGATLPTCMTCPPYTARPAVERPDEIASRAETAHPEKDAAMARFRALQQWRQRQHSTSSGGLTAAGAGQAQPRTESEWRSRSNSRDPLQFVLPAACFPHVGHTNPRRFVRY